MPLGGIRLADSAIGFINTVMMGFLGIQSLAAGALGVITFYTLTLICMGVIEGASPLDEDQTAQPNLLKLTQSLKA